MRLGKETGSVMNYLRGASAQPEPAVGMGCTMLAWTDRFPGTVVRVVSAKTIHVQEDIATRLDGHGMSESQVWSYTVNPEGRVHVFRLTQSGWRSKTGGHLQLGDRSRYHDYSF